MSIGVLLYCFDTPVTPYHKYAEQCIQLIRKNLKINEITVVTNIQTFKKFKNVSNLNFKIIENKINNTRLLEGKTVPWYNLERSCAYEHSPYDTTILMDVDYFCFTDNLLQFVNTEYDFLVHNKVHDLTNRNSIIRTHDSLIPIVWATVTIFKKTPFAKQIFDMIKHIQKNYEYYCHLYRIRFKNYRNDFAFAIALHHLHGQNENKYFIPSKMSMLGAGVKILELNDNGVTFKYANFVNKTIDQDIHIMDKEFLNE